MIHEKEREALMRLTMCARDQCVVCKYKDKNTYEDCQLEITEDMNILADALSDWTERKEGRKKGRWIRHEVKTFDGCHTGRFFDECSECGKLTPEWRKITEYHGWNYCPSCGSRMDEE